MASLATTMRQITPLVSVDISQCGDAGSWSSAFLWSTKIQRSGGRMRIRRLGVVGAGTMGGGIAALAASAGVPVVLARRPGTTGDRQRRRARRAGTGEESQTGGIHGSSSAPRPFTIGNTDDDFGALADCDLVVEAIIEQVEPKRALYERLEAVLPAAHDRRVEHVGHPDAAAHRGARPIVSARASSACTFSIRRDTCICWRSFRPRRRRARRSTRRGAFSDRILGKGIVVAKDVPGFVANRLGVFGMVLAIRMMEKHDLTIDEVDVLTGALIGRSKSATFRTADLSGIDVIAHVTTELSESTGEDFSLSPWVQDLVKAGRTGEKTGAGFYKRVGKEIHTLDWRTGEYGPQAKPGTPELARLCALPLDQRFAAIREWTRREGAFVREYLLRFSHYVLAPRRSSRTTCRRSIMRWSGATPGRRVRSSRWISSARISCGAGSPSSASTSRRCSARPPTASIAGDGDAACRSLAADTRTFRASPA